MPAIRQSWRLSSDFPCGQQELNHEWLLLIPRVCVDRKLRLDDGDEEPTQALQRGSTRFFPTGLYAYFHVSFSLSEESEPQIRETTACGHIVPSCIPAEDFPAKRLLLSMKPYTISANNCMYPHQGPFRLAVEFQVCASIHSHRITLFYVYSHTFLIITKTRFCITGVAKLH